MEHLFFKKAVFPLAIGFFLLNALTSCSKKTAQIDTVSINEIKSDHQWYFFTNEGFEKTSLPQKSGISSLKPWTETLRASDANTDSDGKGIILVNRMGVIILQDKHEPSLMQDFQIFTNTTASNLVFDQNNAYITMSRSSFFNKEASLAENSSSDPERPFLIRVSVENRTFFPVVTYGDLNLASGGEITGTHFDGTNFLCSIKSMTDERTYFSYIKWHSKQALESLAPYTVAGKISINSTSEDEYRKSSSPAPYKKSPERLKRLLSSIPKDFEFAVTCKNSGGTSARIFTTDTSTSGLSKANAIISGGWICAVFPDGTTYFNGALDGRPILNSGKNIAFRLPKLPENYIYGSFCLSGSTLAVCWEETDFYKTGRSGFLTVDLGKILYGDL